MNDRTIPGRRVVSGLMERRWRGKRVGDAADAGAICGVVGETYQYYVKRLGAPKSVVALEDPKSGRVRKVYDLDAVEAWHASRPGRGYRTDLDRVEG